MAQSGYSRWTWRLLTGLLLVVLAQACGGGSSKSTGPAGGRVALEFREARAARAGQLPAGCSLVVVEISPEGIVLQVTEAGQPLSVRLTAGPHTAKGTLFCGLQQFVATSTFVVPPGLQAVEVALVFGDVQVQLTVQAGQGVSVSGPGIACPGDCTQTYINGTAVALKASSPDAVFSGGCSGKGGCTVVMNGDRTVSVALPAATPPSPPPPDGFIEVDNVDPCGECGGPLDIFIDGVLVADDLGVFAPPVATQVAPGSHTVTAFCFGSFEHPDSPQTPDVPPGGTVSVAFDSGNCD